MAFKVGDRVRMATAYVRKDYGHESTISRVINPNSEDTEGEYRLSELPPSGDKCVYFGELELIAPAVVPADPQPAQTHDYMIGYAAGYLVANFPELRPEAGHGADYQAGFVAGMRYGLDEALEGAMAILALNI